MLVFIVNKYPFLLKTHANTRKDYVIFLLERPFVLTRVCVVSLKGKRNREEEPQVFKADKRNINHTYRYLRPSCQWDHVDQPPVFVKKSVNVWVICESDERTGNNKKEREIKFLCEAKISYPESLSDLLFDRSMWRTIWSKHLTPNQIELFLHKIRLITNDIRKIVGRWIVVVVWQ